MFKKYTYGSLAEELPISEPFYTENYNELITAAGFNPQDEEVTLCELIEEWNGHDTGSLVVTGLQVEGHRFAVKSPPTADEVRENLGF